MNPFVILIMLIFYVAFFPSICWFARWWERRESRQRHHQLEEWQQMTHAPGCAYVTEEYDHRLVDCVRCPARARCEHHGADACCFGQWGRACNVPNACVDQDACREVTKGTAVVVAEEHD